MDTSVYVIAGGLIGAGVAIWLTKRHLDVRARRKAQDARDRAFDDAIQAYVNKRNSEIISGASQVPYTKPYPYQASRTAVVQNTGYYDSRLSPVAGSYNGRQQSRHSDTGTLIGAAAIGAGVGVLAGAATANYLDSLSDTSPACSTPSYTPSSYDSYDGGSDYSSSDSDSSDW